VKFYTKDFLLKSVEQFIFGYSVKK